ncbi:hypothetical protein BJ508DRAFT_313731 [Ascobolus immersus RN42]|uniref:Uncharacterized protein n=1 Tax=Ascobolus immersus RN42 TaxID=1160509 RepID=A0A3N4HHU7_ASCIM|nr:hypothetical protein BJ508DRAFT_313731 [Ascobolus immersus RN42]
MYRNSGSSPLQATEVLILGHRIHTNVATTKLDPKQLRRVHKCRLMDIDQNPGEHAAEAFHPDQQRPFTQQGNSQNGTPHDGYGQPRYSSFGFTQQVFHQQAFHQQALHQQGHFEQDHIQQYYHPQNGYPPATQQAYYPHSNTFGYGYPYLQAPQGYQTYHNVPSQLPPSLTDPAHYHRQQNDKNQKGINRRQYYRHPELGNQQRNPINGSHQASRSTHSTSPAAMNPPASMAPLAETTNRVQGKSKYELEREIQKKLAEVIEMAEQLESMSEKGYAAGSSVHSSQLPSTPSRWKFDMNDTPHFPNMQPLRFHELEVSGIYRCCMGFPRIINQKSPVGYAGLQRGEDNAIFFVSQKMSILDRYGYLLPKRFCDRKYRYAVILRKDEKDKVVDVMITSSLTQSSTEYEVQAHRYLAFEGAPILEGQSKTVVKAEPGVHSNIPSYLCISHPVRARPLCRNDNEETAGVGNAYLLETKHGDRMVYRIQNFDQVVQESNLYWETRNAKMKGSKGPKAAVDEASRKGPGGTGGGDGSKRESRSKDNGTEAREKVDERLNVHDGQQQGHDGEAGCTLEGWDRRFIAEVNWEPGPVGEFREATEEEVAELIQRMKIWDEEDRLAPSDFARLEGDSEEWSLDEEDEEALNEWDLNEADCPVDLLFYPIDPADV